MDKICEQCGTHFETKRSDAKYCGDTCQKKAKRTATTHTDTQPQQTQEVKVRTVKTAQYDWLIEKYKATVAVLPSKEANIRAKVELLLNNITHGLTKV